MRSAPRYGAIPAVTLVLVLGLVTAACSQAPAASGPKPNGVVARVNGVPITRASLNRVEKFGQFAGTTLTDRSAVEQLISEEIIRQQATKLHVAVSAKELQARVDSLAQGVGGVAALQRQLKSGGLTITDLEASLGVVMLGEKLQVLMFHRTQATRAQALAYYRSRTSLFRQGAAVRLGAVVMRTQAQAKDVLSRIREGLAFASAAQQFSMDPESKQNGGMLGWTDVSSLPAALGKAVAGLKVNQLAKPVQVGPSWYVVKLYGRRAATTLQFAQVGDVILKELTRQARAAALTQWVDRQRAHAKVAILL